MAVSKSVKSTVPWTSTVSYGLLLTSPTHFSMIIRPSSNSISIFAERNIRNGQIDVVVEVKNNKVIINIEDNAGGIEEKYLPYIFENTKSFRKKPSSGLGLYIANLVITEKFKGSISASNSEEGAIFTIILPLKSK